jgi:two-component system sensor histidine kinase MtrB
VGRRALEHPLAAAGAGTARLVRHLQSRWRSSLQLRVVSTTLVVSALVVSLLGFFLMQQVASNLLHSAETQAFTQGREGLVFAQFDPAAGKAPGPGSQDAMARILERLLPTPQTSGPDYGVAITVRHDKAATAYWAAVQSNNVDYRSLQQAASSAPPGPTGHRPMKFASLPYPDASSPKTAGLIYSAPFGTAYRLYYFFPLTQLQNELYLIQRTLSLWAWLWCSCWPASPGW